MRGKKWVMATTVASKMAEAVDLVGVVATTGEAVAAGPLLVLMKPRATNPRKWPVK